MCRQQRPLRQPHPRRGDAMKPLIIALCLFVGLVGLLCCGGGVAGYFWVQKHFGRMVLSTPAEIRALTSEITDIDIPAEFQPMMGSAFFGMKTVIYTHPSSGRNQLPAPNAADPDLATGPGQLTLMSLNPQALPGGASPPAARKNELWTDQQLRQIYKDFTKEEFEHTIRGQVCKFQLIRGKQRRYSPDDDEAEEMPAENDAAGVDEAPADATQPRNTTEPGSSDPATTEETPIEVRSVQGHFPGKNGQVTITITLPAEACDDEYLKRIVQSIR